MPEKESFIEADLADHAAEAIEASMKGKKLFCRFLTANDTGLTGGHQAGIYIAKSGADILFDEPGERGSNKDKRVRIDWQGGIHTDSRFIYYGQKTRNEYRITNFGRGFPFLDVEYTGGLFILIQNSETEYLGYVLNTDDEIEAYLSAFGLTPADTNQMIHTAPYLEDDMEEQEIARFVHSLKTGFPSASEMSAKAREIENTVYNHKERIWNNPDQKLLDWTRAEYRLFKAVEFSRYGERVRNGFPTVDDFVTLANEILNRRKSRAGKGLENHLCALFDEHRLAYESQATTEGKKKPDFLFPSARDYHDFSFPVDRLITLAAKTTCKDRWRQILNEANRLRDSDKYLCTLQQGVSEAQMDEMEQEKVVLVVPSEYIRYFPKTRQDRIWTIGRFIRFVKDKEQADV